MGLFDGQVAWITGAGSGIGRALAIEFAREGAAVALSGRRADCLERTLGDIEALGRRAVAVPCDVRDDEAVARTVRLVVERLGRLDVAVANAGLSVSGPFERLGDADWRRQMDVNLFGAVNTARHALPELRRTSGRLVLVGSVTGMVCTPGSSAYSASKFALRAIGLVLAQELYGSGVSCTTIAPGYVESEIGQVDNEGWFHPEWPDKRPHLLMWSADRAARVMLRAIYRRKREFVFTAHGRFGAWVGRHFPGFIHFAGTRMRPLAKWVMAQLKRF